MATPRTATLSGLLVSKKGTDTRMPEHPGLEAAQTPTSIPNTPSDDTSSAESAEKAHPAYYKALTFKVDRDRFTRLKNLGVQRDLRSQALLTEALDLLFTKHNL